MATGNLNCLCRDPTFIAKKGDEDELFERHMAYYLPGKALKTDIKCASTTCVAETRSAQGSSTTEASVLGKVSTIPAVHPMMLCYACNRTFHVVCLDYSLEVIRGISLPWRCQECIKDETNAAAVAYFSGGEWEKGLKERRRKLFNEHYLKKNPSVLDPHSDDEFGEDDQESVRKYFKNKEKPPVANVVPMETFLRQQEEFKLLMERMTLILEENSDLKGRLENLEKNSQSLKEQKDQLGENGTAGTSRMNVSFASSTFCIPPVLTVQDWMTRQYLDRTRIPQSENLRNAASSVIEEEEEITQGIDISTLNNSERVLLKQVEAQHQSTIAQRDMSNTMSLELRRKALPKIGQFSGNPKDWIRFKRDVKRYQEVGQFDDGLMKMYILQALTGLALERVQDMIDTAPLNITMKILEESFGEVSRIIDKCGEEILSLRLNKDMYKDDAMRVLTKIQAYFSACKYGEVECANTNHLAKHIFEQLSMHHKQLFRHHMRVIHPGDSSKLMNLETMLSFLEDLVKDLEDRKHEEKKKPATVLLTAMTQKATGGDMGRGGSDDYQYVIRDICTSKILGYNMSLVNQLPKRCECCNRNTHYTIECKEYKAMGGNRRAKLVIDKGLCRNCMLTSSHRANDCAVKPSCGFREGNARCTARHHISLHKALSGGGWSGPKNVRQKRRNTNNNTNRALNIAQRSDPPGINALGQSQQEAATSQAPRSSHASAVIAQAPGISHLRQEARQGNFNAIQRIQLSQSLASQGGPNGDPKQALHVATDFQHTVKVFRNKFIGRNGSIVGYSVGDSAAEVTLLSEELRKLLQLEGEQCVIDLQWTDGTVKTIPAIRVNLVVQGLLKNSKVLTLRNCYAIENLDLPTRSLDVSKLKAQFPYLKPVKFESYEEVSPSVLIGSPHASVFESCGPLLEGGEGNPVGLMAKLGWCIYGGSSEEDRDTPVSVQAISSVENSSPLHWHKGTQLSNEELFDALVYFNSLENLGIREIKDMFTEDERKAIDIMEEEVRVLPSGAIELPLAWNRVDGTIPILPNNFSMVYKRQIAQEKRFQRKPVLHEAFNKNFLELIEEGYVRAATERDLTSVWTNVWYLPMSVVVNANKVPVKYRNVFDASAKYMGVSLNSNLLKGPDLLIDLVKPLLRMRMNAVAFTADIKAMFMRMKISERDQQCQRVLWREKPEDEMRIFIVTSMLFGPSCSPFQSQFVKNALAEACSVIYPEAAKTIKEYMYMDDVLTSEATTDKAAEIATQCIKMFEAIDWKLVSFQSNDVQLLKRLPCANVRQEMIPLLEDDREACTTKVLGSMWDTKGDCFVFSFDKNLFVKIVMENKHKPTKRDQCSTIARIFDVLGLISHYTIRGRILLQRSWAAGLDWDDVIPDEEYKLWLEWLTNLENVAKIKIPRKLCRAENMKNAESIELHTFCDAGAEAFAAVSYLVSRWQGKRTSSIVMAKAKVTPLRYKSKSPVTEMPRLELFAALIASRLTDTITSNLAEMKLERFLWSDSEVVLSWLNNRNIKLKKYAVSPVEEILEKTKASEWRYVSTRLNVADIATKLRKFDFGDSESIWFTGPAFLLEERKFWPVMKPEKRIENSDSARVVAEVLNVNVAVRPFCSEIVIPPHNCPIASDAALENLRPSILASWTKLVRAVARALKLHYDGLVTLVKSKQWNSKPYRKRLKSENNSFRRLSAPDLERAELFLIRKAQREGYSKEYEALASGRALDNNEMKQLNVFLDNSGIIRINSRVSLDLKSFPQRFAPMLPRKHPYTRLYLTYIHYEFKHVCIESQIAAVRSKYWIGQLRSELKSIQSHCNYCKLKRAQPYTPLMAPLPDSRTDPTRYPFQTTGLDCLGPFKILPASTNRDESDEEQGEPRKMYVLIFACTLTRFIQLFILESLRPVEVLEAIVSFWNSNGPIQTLISDNGRNFTGAAKYLVHEQNETMKELNQHHAHLAPLLAEKYRMEWKFLPAHSPWMGAFYERLIKEVKRAIASSIERRQLDKIEFNIALQDASHRINCRPLTHNAITSEDEPVLTPHHLAKFRPGWPYLPGVQENFPSTSDRSWYRRGRELADTIMNKFTLFYLPILTKRVRWLKESKPLQIGDLVLLIEPNNTRNEWKRGRVVKLYKGTDGRTRVADVMMADHKIKKARSVQRLARIEVDDSPAEP